MNRRRTPPRGVVFLFFYGTVFFFSMVENEFTDNSLHYRTIHLLQDNLCDRYKDNFSIVQELLQNADDAKASHVHFGLSNGLKAKCVLLNCPALVVINDGPVSPSDLDAIFRVAAGNKQDDEDKIGKFGLGMKSVFHVCEGFFMFGHGLEIQSELPCFCTPWSDDYHASWWNDWDSEKESALEQVSARVAPIVAGWRQWFCVWIPLRNEEQLEGISPILKKFPSPRQWAELVGVETGERISKMLPLLKQVEELSFSGVEGEGRRYALKAENRLNLKDGFIKGEVQSEGEGAKSYCFDGISKLYSGEACFRELQNLSCWPETTHKESLRGSVAKKIYDKTKPHAAVCVLIERSDKPRLTISPCVFLPLSGPQERKDYYSTSLPSSDESVTVYMHGSMFVDAGRQDLSVGLPIDGLPGDETTLRKEWNRQLWEKAILPLLIPQLFKSLSEQPKTLSAVVDKFAAIEFARTWIRKACAKDCIAKVLTKEGYVWKCLPSAHRLFAIGKIEDAVTRDLICDSLPVDVLVVESSRDVLSGEDEVATVLPEKIKARIIETAALRSTTLADSDEALDFVLKCVKDVDLSAVSREARTAKLWRHCNQLLSYDELKSLVKEHKVFSGYYDYSLMEHFEASVDWAVHQVDADVNINLHLEAQPFCAAFVVGVLEKCPPLKCNIRPRALLLKYLLQDGSKLYGVWRKVCRYLVHGQSQLFESDEQIFLPINDDARFSSLIINVLAEQKFGVQCSVDGEIVRELSPQDCQAIGLCSSTPAELVVALGEVASRASFEDFPEGSWKKLVMLASLDEPGVREALLRIPLFPTVRGELVSLGNACYWEDEFKIHTILRDKVNILVPLGADTASKRVKQLAQKWTDQTCYKQSRDLPPGDLSVVLTDLLQNNLDLTRDCREYLAEMRWLELNDGEIVAPSEIVAIPGISGLVPGLFYQTDVKDQVAASLVAERGLLPDETASLTLVFDFLGRDDRFKIGRLSNVCKAINTFTAESVKTALRDQDAMPVLKVLKGLDDQGLCYDRFLSRLCGEIPVDRLVATINGLTERLPSAGAPEQAALLWAFLIDYLEEASDKDEFIDDILPRLHFLNINGVIKNPNELCTGGASIPDDRVIHYRYLRSERLKSTFIVHSEKSRREDEHECEMSFEKYFEGWDSSLERQIGTFIICSSNLPEDVALVRERYGYEHLDIEDARTSICEWLNDVIRNQHIKIHVVAGNTINAVAIDGSELPITLNSIAAADDLFYGQFNPHEVEHIQTTGGRGFVITRWLKLNLRLPNQQELEDVPRLKALLKKSTEAVLLEYGAGECLQKFRRYWEKLSDGEQLEIAPTKAMILENAVGYLPSIGCKPPELRDLFNKWHNLFVAEAQASDNNDQARVLKHVQEKNRIRRELERIILGSVKLQKSILESVRRKIRKGYSYSEQSIIYELFQNADDAAEELRELYDDPKPQFIDRFVVKHTSTLLIIVHWGRMINQEKAGAGTGRRFDGFKRDLQKMLLISQSDKDQDEINVIGRFGLGFKTVHFVTDNPVVFSGNLRFRIVGGYLPETLSAVEECQYKTIRDEIESGERHFPATIFCLPINEDKQTIVRDVVDQFKVYAELLTIFSRRIKWLEVKSETGAVSVHCEMTPLKPDLEIYLCGTEHSYAVFRLKDAEVLFGWDNGRFVPLDNDVPTIWATAPTRVRAGLGIAINANFDLDTGRGVLNDNSPDNVRLAEAVASELYDELVRLYKACDEEERYRVFASLYHVLADKERRENWKSDSAHSLSECLRMVLWREKKGAYRRLMHDLPVIPSCLDGDLECLCKIDEIEHMVEDRIANSELKRLIPSGKFRPGTVTAFDLYKVGQINFPDDVRHVPQYKVRDLIDDLRNAPHTSSPEWCSGDGARVLMQNVDKENALEMEALRQFEFQTEAGSLNRCDTLLLNDEYDGPKAAFMPEEYVLSRSYDQQGVDFVRLCRGEGRIKTKVLVAQAVCVKEFEKQVAVLKYLANGNPSEEFKKEIREAKGASVWLRNWLHAPAAKALTNSERDAVARVLSVNEDEYGATMKVAYAQELFFTSVDEVTSLVKLPDFKEVLEWWNEHKREELIDYNREIYERDIVPDLRFYDESFESRSEWMEVLVLGAAHGLGFKNCQHKGFVQMLKRRGYWKVYCKKEMTPAEWLSTIDDFLDNEEMSNGQYNYWMRLFFRIYQFSRHLDTYCALFESWNYADECQQPDLSAIKKNSKLRGTGIDAPGLQKALPLRGLHFVYREMVRRNAITKPVIYPQCFVPYEKVLRLAWGTDSSVGIYNRVKKEIGEENVTFGKAFDIAITQYVARMGGI